MSEQKNNIVITIITFLKGMVIGVAQIIPGVSGGTLALVMGIYERFIKALNDVSACALAFLGWLKGFKREKWDAALEKFKAIEWVFLILLFIGMFAAIVATSGLITWLLEFHHAKTFGLFFGLIIASVIVPWEKMEKKGLPEVAAFLIGLLLLLWISGLGKALPKELSSADFAKRRSAIVNVEKQKLFDSAYIKSGDAYVLADTLTSAEKTTVGKLLQRSSKPALWFLFIAGIISISAMILPGLSGSFILLVMGVYGYVVGLINLLKEMDMSVLLPIGVFGVGLVLGLFSFARLMEYLLKKYHSVTMAFLIGLMLGSLRKIWPFSSGMPGGTLLFVIGAILAGIVIVLVLHFSTRNKQEVTN